MPHPLTAGPYRSPRLRIGGAAWCERSGDVVVSGYTDAPISWPYSRPEQGGGRVRLILTGDLIRAVRSESVSAVADHWGVSRWTVSRWRATLGVGRWTTGTRDLWSQLADARLTTEGRRRGGLATHAGRRSTDE